MNRSLILALMRCAVAQQRFAETMVICLAKVYDIDTPMGYVARRERMRHHVGPSFNDMVLADILASVE